jgi:hypothetical protein
MSDASIQFCRKCREPEYACECFEPALLPSLVSLLMAEKPDREMIKLVKSVMFDQGETK